MAYQLVSKDSFFRDFIALDRNDQKRLTSALDEISQKPNKPRGDTIKKLKHHENLWRYRIGDKRLIYAVFPKRQAVCLLAIGPRGDIYSRINYNPEAPDLANFAPLIDDALNPDKEAPADWGDFARPDEVDERHLTYLLTPKQLKEWNIPEKLFSALQNCRTEDQLLEAQVPDFYKERIIELMAPPSRIEDMVQQPNRVLNKIEDLEAYSSGQIGLMDFLLFLDEEQEKLIDWSLKGPTLVKGGAGSGKSTIALYRARELCRQAAQQLIPPKILFTTYTNALTNASEQLFDHLVGELKFNLKVSTVDSIAWNIVSKTDGRLQMASSSDIREAIRSGCFTLRKLIDIQPGSSQGKTQLQRQLDDLGHSYLLDEIEWVIDGRGLENLDEYLKANRSGRGVGLSENMRKIIWRLYGLFREYLVERDLLTYALLRKRALEIIQNEQWKDKFDYVLVDEAQDLSPIGIQLCLALCEAPAGLFLTADAGQSIYNRGFSWKKVHDDLRIVGRTRVLKRNYRTTREIAVAVNQILLNSPAGDKEALDQFYVHSGPKPEYYAAGDESDMIYWLYQAISTARQKLRMPLSAAAVLSTSNEQARKLARELSSLGLPTKFMASKQIDLDCNCVKSITIHSAKGLEFPILAVPYAEEGMFPRVLNKNAQDLDEQIAYQRRLFYVGCSRAMRRLYISWRKDTQSRYLDDLGAWQKSALM